MLQPEGTFDPATEDKLDRWVAAKRDKDFATADSIRAELRALGIEPDTVRPSDKDLQSQAAVASAAAAYAARHTARYEAAIEAKLDRWVLAKREKDFGTADAIRAELRSVGIEPDSVRPPERELSGFPAYQVSTPSLGLGLTALQTTPRYDPATEAKLDRWVLAKREKDFGTADAIRAELRALGIEPDNVRPSDKDFAPIMSPPIMKPPSSPPPTMLGHTIGLLGQQLKPAALTTNVAGARFDASTEAKLDRWVAAKREKDFGTADTLRAELRALGIEPDTVRPPDREMLPNTPIDPAVEAKLDRWVAAKREKDFGTADAIRAELRAVGIEPDSLRPPEREMMHGLASPTLLPGMRFDSVIEEKLDRWVVAKRDKDWDLADNIRGELRALGIEPDVVRPPDRDLKPNVMLDPTTEAKLDRWVLAKREKDFGTADAIRAELRAVGLEPDSLRPPERELPLAAKVPPGPGSKFDMYTEAKLDRWVQAKRDKDFAMADALRAELRTRGIEPDIVRPSDKEFTLLPQSQMIGLPAQAGGLSSGLAMSSQLTPVLTTAPQFSNNWGYLNSGLQQQPQVVITQPTVLTQVPQIASAGSLRGLVGKVFDHETESQLDRWVTAKRDKDFAMADLLRTELRAKGIEPDTVRPSDKDIREKITMIKPEPLPVITAAATSAATLGGLAPLNLSPGLQREVERQLDRWVEAKRAKDFATADLIRKQLRAKGIDPDSARPPGHEVDGGLAKRARSSAEGPEGVAAGGLGLG